MRVVKSAEVRREEILDCAERLFATKGYDGTPVNEIIANLGISKGAFYHHFESKEHLLQALAGRIAAEVARGAESILADPSLDAFARLNAFLRHSRRQKVAMASRVRATFDTVFRQENVHLYHRTHAAITAVIRPILARIIAEGVADRAFDTKDTEAAAAVIVQLVVTTHDLVAELLDPDGPASAGEVVDRLAARLDFLGTVIDRILGIPEGSIRLAERDELEAIAGHLLAPASAA